MVENITGTEHAARKGEVVKNHYSTVTHERTHVI
jgi:hypothetical protein